MASKGGENNRRDSSTHCPGEAIQAQPLEVKVYGNNFEKALKAFRALVQKERILSAYKEKQTYEKPSDKRRRKKNELKRNAAENNTRRKNTPSTNRKNSDSNNERPVRRN